MGNVLSTSFALFFKKFPVYMLLALIISSPVIVVAMLLEGKGLIAFLGWSKLFMQQLIMAAIVYSVFRHMRKEPAEMGRCLAIAVSRFLPLLVVRTSLGLSAAQIFGIVTSFIILELVTSRILFKFHLRKHPY